RSRHRKIHADGKHARRSVLLHGHAVEQRQSPRGGRNLRQPRLHWYGHFVGGALQCCYWDFARTGSMSAQRSSHRATWLTDGAVMVTGGATSTGVTSKAELFHALNGRFERTGSMRSQRELHTATGMTNGAALAAGGIDGWIP